MIIPDDEFDSAAGQVAASASKDPVDAAAAQVVQGQRTQLRSALYSSLLENPDMAARAQTLGRQAGIPADVVSRNMPEVQRNVQLDEFDKVLQNSPTVATWLTEQENAKIAHDDVENLSALDSALKFVSNTGSAAKGGLLSASAGVVGVVRAPLDVVTPLLDPLAGTVLPENPLRRVGAGLAKYQGNIQAQADAAMPKAEGVIGSGYYSGIGSLSRNMASLPLLFLPGGQKAALTSMVAPVAGQEYGEARDKGLGVVPAITYGTSQAAIEYATEKIPVSRLLGDLKAGSSFAKTLGRQLAVEIPGEQVATIFQDLNEFAVLRPDATFGDYLAERPDAAAQTLVATIVGVGGQTTIVKGIDSALNRFAERENLAQDAEQTAQNIDQINQLAAASKVLQRDPQSFAAFVEKASAEHNVTDVFIDARILNQSAQEAGLTMDQMPPSVQAQLAEALQTGGDIRIPVAEYATLIAPTEYAQGLLDHLKTNPQGMSRAEAQVFMQSQSEELQAEVERVLTEKAQDDAFKTSAEAVKAQIAEQLNAVGRFEQDVNLNYATVLANFYAVTAAKIGMTPEQMAARYPVRVESQDGSNREAQYDQGSQRFTEDNRLSNLNPSGASWQRIRESNPVLRDLGPDDEITVYRATIGDEVRPDDFVAVDKSTLRKELKNVQERDGATAKIIEKRVKVRDLLMANDATEFVYFPDGQQFNQDSIANDAEYLAAVERGDMEAAQKMVDQAARAAGYISGADYRMAHQAPNSKSDVSLANLRESGLVPDDYWTKPEWYQSTPEERASWEKVTKAFRSLDAKSKPGKPYPVSMTVYRAVPKDVKDGSIRNGDWITPSADYAKMEGANIPGGYRVISQQVLVKDLYWDGNSMAELGYDDGKEYAYKNTKNNRKLMDAVTRDDDGNIVPLSKRFNKRSEEVFNQGPRGRVSFADDITQAASVITLLKGADLSTFLHEAGHFFLEVQMDLASRIEGEAATFGSETNTPGEVEIIRDSQALLDWFGVESVAAWHAMPIEEKREFHERFARGFEAYLFEGKAPNLELQNMFQRFRSWMISVYNDLVNLNVELTPEVRGVMDRMIATAEQIELAESGRSMMPLFASAEQAGMTTEEFSAYQSLGIDASQEAIQNLQARTLRDMAWMKNAKGREIKKLQKQAEGLRAEVSMEARREIMSQPVYRAWQFLTGKASPEASSRTRVTGGTPVETVPPVLIGVDGEQFADGGKPFKSHTDAKEAKKLQANTRVVKVEGGWALAEKTEAQLAAEEKAAKRLSLGTTGPKGMPEAAHAFIASKGGLSKSEMADTGFDRNVRVGSKWLFAGDGKGMSIEQAAMLLKEYGYTSTEEHNEAYDLIKRSVTDPQYTAEGFERIAEIEAEAMTADEMPGLGLDIEVTTVGKFDLSALKSLGLPDEVVQIMVDLKMTDVSGIHPDIVADVFEFQSGEDLVRTLAVAESPKEAIESLTDQKMAERYGELSSPEAIEQAADIAIHNDVRARFVAAELNAVNKAAGRPKILAAAAKEFAAKMINRLQIKNIKPNQYAAAEARAAKAAMQAMREGNTEVAANEKRNQLINAYATKAAYDAQAEVQKIRRFFGTVTKGNNKKLVERGRDPDVVNAARAILSAYGISTGLEKGAQDYLGVLERQDPGMFEVLRPSVQAALSNAKPFDQLTMEELRGLNDEISAMWHLSKRSRQMEVDGDLLDMDEVADELTKRIADIGIPDTIPGEKGAITKVESAKQSLQFAGAVLRRVEQWAETKDGKFGGPFLRFVFQPVKAAADRYRADRARYRKAFLGLVEGVAPSMKQGIIEAPEIGYTFGRGHNGVGMAELLHAVLHTGNESNKRKLLLGRGWAIENADGTMDTSAWDSFIDRMQLQKRLTKAHYDFAQGVWDLLEDMKPLAQKTHRDVFGRYFDEVTANEFETPFGTYRGGYVPAQADPRIVNDAAMRALAEQENENLAYSFPSTSKGFTKGRVEYNRPLILDLRTITQHMDKVLLFSHMEPAVRDVNKLLMRKGVSSGLSRIDPAAYEGLLIPWLNRAARQQVETPIVGDGRISRVLSTVRNRAGMALMFGNISNTLQQITGFSSVLSKVKSSHMKRAVAEYVKNPKKMTDAVAEASIFMKDRMANEVAAIQNQMDEILLDPSLYEKAQAWTNKHAYFLQSAVDNIMSPMVWTGAYNQAITEGMSDADAVKFADGVVRQTQGATLPEDVSRIETGPAYARIFTQFIGYFNMMANTTGTELQKVQQEVGLRKGAGRALGILFFGLLAPAWIAEAIAIAMRGGPEDEDDDGYLDDWLGAVIGMGTLKTLLAGVPFVGQFINVGINKFNDNPMDDRVSLSPAVSLLETAVSAPQSVYKALAEDGSKAKAVKDVATAVSIFTGLPAHWAARPISYLTGIADDRIEPTGPVDFGRGLVTGVASPESKQ